MLFQLASYTYLKYLNLIVGVGFGFIQIHVFTRYLDIPKAAFLTTAYSLFYYFSFLDLGLTKPFYANIRKVFIGGDWGKSSFFSEIFISIILSLMGIFPFVVVLFGFQSYLNAEVSSLPIFLIGISFAINFGLVFLRSFFDAVDQFFLYEKIEFTRRIILIIGLYPILFDSTLLVHSATIATLSLFLYLVALFNLKQYYPNLQRKDCSIRLLKKRLKSYQESALRSINFSFSDGLLNNLGLFIFPLIFAPIDVLSYHIWIRLYRGSAMFSRTIFEIRLHSITETYFGKKYEKCFQRFKNALLASLLIAGCSAVIISLSANFVVRYLTSGLIAPSGGFVFGLTMIILANAVLHSGGAFLMATGDNFRFCQKMSNYSLFIGGGLIVTSSLVFCDKELFFVLHPLIFLVTAGFYLRRVARILN